MNYQLRFLLAVLIEWPLCLLVSGAFTLAALFVVPLALYFEAYELVWSPRFGDQRRVLDWTWRWMRPWGNDEDGIDGIPLLDGFPFKYGWWREKTKGWSQFRRIFTWCVLRNSASNLRFMPITGYKINPAALRLGWHSMYVNPKDLTHDGQSWFMWEGWRSNFYFEWHSVHFWIGWPQKPEDLPDFWDFDDLKGDLSPHELPAEDTRAPGVSFKLQIRRNH